MLHRIFEYLTNLHLPLLVFITIEAGIAWTGFFIGGLMGGLIRQWRSKKRLKKILDEQAWVIMKLETEMATQENLENYFSKFSEAISTSRQNKHWIKDDHRGK